MAHSSFGSGWPSCNRSQIVTLSRPDGLRLPVHTALADLIGIGIDVTEALGYDVKPGESWGYACRAIAGTNTPSNHSWGTAIDINAPSNPRRKKGLPMITNLPRSVIDFWKGQNFRWGGDYSWPDPMHFEFMGSTTEARERAHNLRVFFGNVPPPPAYNPPAYPGLVKMGSRGNAVRVWQQAFRDRRGYRDLVVDGIFGQATSHVVWHFQTNAGLPVDRICGPKTWHAVWFG